LGQLNSDASNGPLGDLAGKKAAPSSDTLFSELSNCSLNHQSKPTLSTATTAHTFNK